MAKSSLYTTPMLGRVQPESTGTEALRTSSGELTEETIRAIRSIYSTHLVTRRYSTPEILISEIANRNGLTIEEVKSVIDYKEPTKTSNSEAIYNILKQLFDARVSAGASAAQALGELAVGYSPDNFEVRHILERIYDEHVEAEQSQSTGTDAPNAEKEWTHSNQNSESTRADLAIKLEEANKEIERISQELESKNAELEEAHKSVEYWRNKVLYKPSIPRAKVRSSG